MQSLRDQVAVITGAGQGIGRAVAGVLALIGSGGSWIAGRPFQILSNGSLVLVGLALIVYGVT